MPPDYSLDKLPARVEAATAQHAGYISSLLARYQARQRLRRENDVPVVAFCGMGRAGKDTAAEYWCARAGLRYAQSSSWFVLPIMATLIGIPPEQAWAERHQHRDFWVAACHAFRGREYDLLLRMALGAGDVAVGIRGRIELVTVKRNGVVDLLVWIDKPGVPVDPTVEYGPGDCDLGICNSGSFLEFYAKLDGLLALLKAPWFARNSGGLTCLDII